MRSPIGSPTNVPTAIVSKKRINRHGNVSGGAALSRGALYNILRNPIYIGKTRHKEDLHAGLHDAIIADTTWQALQIQLADHGGKKISTGRRSAKRFLDGVLFDSMGRAMRTTYASKSVCRDGTTRTKRYWYYMTAMYGSKDGPGIERLPAQEIERVVLNGLEQQLADTGWVTDQINGNATDAYPVAEVLRAINKDRVNKNAADGGTRDQLFPGIIDRIDAKTGRLCISVNLAAIPDTETPNAPILAAFEIPFERRQNGRAKPIVIAAKEAAQHDPDLIALVADARRGAGELLDGKALSVQQITEREGLRSGAVSRILPLAWLAPDISTAILEGRQPPLLTAKILRNLPELPLDWAKQRQILGFKHR